MYTQRLKTQKLGQGSDRWRTRLKSWSVIKNQGSASVPLSRTVGTFSAPLSASCLSLQNEVCVCMTHPDISVPAWPLRCPRVCPPTPGSLKRKASWPSSAFGWVLPVLGVTSSAVARSRSLKGKVKAMGQIPLGEGDVPLGR